MTSKPLVSIIMSVYNTELYLREAVISIINQSYRNLEILICNDCSTDKSQEILTDLAQQDQRIILINNNENFKLAKSLNKLIDLSHGKYIARMDADDISHPERITKEVLFLENNPEFDIVGCNAWNINAKNLITGESFLPTTNEDIQIFKDFFPPFYHPTVVFRANFLKENKYNEDYVYAQDFELWLRLLKKTKAYNLNEHLFLYRIESCKDIKKVHIQNTNKLRALFEHNIDVFSFSPKHLKSRKAKLAIYKYLFKQNGLLSLELIIFLIYYQNKLFRYFRQIHEKRHLQ